MHRGTMHLQHITLDRLRRDCQHEVENETFKEARRKPKMNSQNLAKAKAQGKGLL